MCTGTPVSPHTPRRRRAPTGSDQSHEDGANRGVPSRIFVTLPSREVHQKLFFLFCWAKWVEPAQLDFFEPALPNFLENNRLSQLDSKFWKKTGLIQLNSNFLVRSLIFEVRSERLQIVSTHIIIYYTHTSSYIVHTHHHILYTHTIIYYTYTSSYTIHTHHHIQSTHIIMYHQHTSEPCLIHTQLTYICLGVATISRCPKYVGLFCKRGLQKYGSFAEETY